MEENKVKIGVPVLADLAARGKKPEYVFWVGSAGAFDDRYKKVTRAFVKVLTCWERTMPYWEPKSPPVVM